MCRKIYHTGLILIPILLAAFAIRIYAIHLPGPYGDEITVALPAYQMNWGELPFAYNVYVFGRWLPVTIGEYTGAVPIYAQFLFSYLAGSYWFGFRILDLLYALAAIALTYFFACDFLSRRAALISALLLSFMPSFVFYSRVGEHVLFLRVVLSSALLFCFYRWWRTGNWRYFYVGCLSVGLGLSTRLEIGWWVSVVLLYLLLAHRSALSEIISRVRTYIPQVLAGASYFLLGASLFLAYNIGSKGGTLTYIKNNLFITTAGHSNLTVAQNLYRRVQNLIVLLNGGDGGDFGVAGFTFTNDLYPLTFFTSVALLTIWICIRRLRGSPDRRAEFLLLATSLMLMISIFTVSTLRPMHLLMMMPLPVLIITRALDFLRLRVVIVAITVALLAGDIVTDVNYYQTLMATQGVGTYSSAIFDLVQHLRERQVRSVVACDWRLLQLVQFVSRGEIGGQEIFGYELGYEGVPPSFYQKLEAALHNPENVYLFYAPRYEQFKRHQAFLRYLESQGLSYERTILYDKNGQIYYVYRIREHASSDRF